VQRIFTEFGLDSKLIRQLERHRAKIQLASLEAEMVIQQLLTARYDYDQRIRAILNPAQYNQYRQFEASRPAAQEFGFFQQYAWHRGVAVELALQQSIIDFLQRCQAYTDLSWHGPYDGLPDPAYGDTMVLAQTTNWLDRVSEAARQISRHAAGSQVDESHLQLLESYFAEAIQKKRDLVASINQRATNNPSGLSTDGNVMNINNYRPASGGRTNKTTWSGQ
jgi:hypothetical protein